MSLSSERLQYRWLFMRIMEICAMFHVSPENRSFVLISLHMVCIWFDLSYSPTKCTYAPTNRSKHSNRKLIVIRRYTKFIPTISVVRSGIFRYSFECVYGAYAFMEQYILDWMVFGVWNGLWSTKLRLFPISDEPNYI